MAGTFSINLFFGSGYMPPKTGVLLNDTMDDFSIKSGTPNAFALVGNAANAIAPNKRSLSSMAPTFVETPKGLMIIGTPGGSCHCLDDQATQASTLLIGGHFGSQGREGGWWSRVVNSS